jgi:hypothetical protein
MRGLIGQDRSALLALLSIFLAMRSVGAAVYGKFKAAPNFPPPPQTTISDERKPDKSEA